MSTPSQPAGRPPVTREVSDRLVKAVLCVLVGVVVSVVALIILTPRRPPPPASPAQPDQAIIDRVGVVSPSYARTTAGALLNEPLAQILVYVDARPASGSIESYTTHAASTWNVGNERADNGLVLFVFPDVRIARVEVGYGLEGTLPDARVRQLLESALVPGLARGDYEVGLDTFLAAVRQEMRNDATLHAATVDGHARADFSLAVFKRFPSLLRLTWFRFGEEGTEGRIGIMVFAVVIAGVLAFGVALVVNTLWRLVTLPGNLANARSAPAGTTTRRQGGPPTAVLRSLQVLEGIKLFEIVMGIGGVVFCAVVLMLVLSLVENNLTRKGRYSGAGAAITWPAAPPR